MKDREQLKKRKDIRTVQINKLLKKKGYRSAAAYKRHIDYVRENPDLFPGKEFAASATFRNLMDGKSIQSDFIEQYADDLDTSTDYLLGRTPYISIGNEEISAITGLSDDAIEVLRRINSASKETNPANGEGQDSRLIIHCINLLLENTRFMRGFYVENLFRYISWYILKNPKIMDLKPLKGAETAPVQRVYFDSDESYHVPFAAPELYRTTVIKIIEDKLNDIVKEREGKNNGKH